jgi:hypothetical protein
MDAACNKKKYRQEAGIFFTLCQPATAGWRSYPFEPLMKGLRPERMKRSGMSGESKPHLSSYEWGKPGGKGEGQFFPPIPRRLSTLGMM